MSSSNPPERERFPFLIRPHSRKELVSEDALITVYDGWDEVVSHDYGSRDLSLPKGLYIVRTEFAGEMEEQVVRHAGPTEVEARVPERHSPIPLFGTVTSHEYYAYPCETLSRQDTSDPIGEGQSTTSRLFLFIRASRQEAYKGEDLGEGLCLANYGGEVLTDFGKDVTVRDTHSGFLAFSAPVVPGAYILRFAGDLPRDIPIYLYDGWETQVFVTYYGRPLFEGAAILMAPLGDGFDSETDETAHAVDMALTGLQNDVEIVPRHVMSDLLNRKFVNPMLGILGAHLLLRRPEPDPGSVEIVLTNLSHLIPDSPDVKALEMMAARRFEGHIPPEPFYYPPMLRAGLEAVITASNECPELLPEGGPIDRISTRQYSDSPWSSWKPLPLVSERGIRGEPIYETSRWLTNENWKGLLLDVPTAIDIEMDVDPQAQEEGDWLEASLRDAIAWSEKTDRSLDLAKFARELGVPLRNVERMYKKLSATPLADA